MKKSILGIAVAMSLTSCATIVSGSKQTINFNSTPTNATVVVDGQEIGKTPLQTKLERKHDHNVEIKLDGYKTYNVAMKKTFNEWYIGNILFGGIIGLVVDPITGAIYRLTPKEVNAELGNTTANKANKDAIIIAVNMTPDPSWVKVGQMEKL